MSLPRVPGYVRERWDGFVTGRWDAEVRAFERASGMVVDASEPPFVFAGNLSAPVEGGILTFGLAPHSPGRRAAPPSDAAEYFQRRLESFDSDATPHQLHGFLGRLAHRALVGGPVPPGRLSRWLHANGYISFDLVPYHVRDWGEIGWTDDSEDGVPNTALGHVRSCLGLVRGHRPRLVVFTGADWARLLVERPAPGWPDFESHAEARLCTVLPNRPYQSSKVYAGLLELDGVRVPAAIVSHLIHQARISHEDSESLGGWISGVLPLSPADAVSTS